MVPKERGFNQSVAASGMCARKAWRFPCSPAMGSDGEAIQRQNFCHNGDTSCHPKSGYVTTKLHGTSTCWCNNNAIFSDRAIFTFPVVVICRPRLTASKHWRFMPNLLQMWQHCWINYFRVQDFLSAQVPCQILWLYCKVVQWDIM